VLSRSLVSLLGLYVNVSPRLWFEFSAQQQQTQKREPARALSAALSGASSPLRSLLCGFRFGLEIQ